MTDYAELAAMLESLLASEHDLIANAANTSALIYSSVPDLNWAGFYFLKESELVVGPFQGKPACVRIALGQGVCGTAAAARKTIVVPDVHAFPGHIACDAASLSEIVIPLRKDDPKVKLALQPLVEEAYVNGRYSRRLDYGKPCVPPLDAADAAWARTLLSPK